MSLIVREHTYVDSKPARPSHANANEIKLFNEINGNLDWANLKAALVNAANGLVKLDGSGDVPLAQIPDTLTGKDVDTLDTKHYSDIATEIDEDIATHKADASAHHAKTTDHGELGGLGDDDHPQYLKKSGGTMVGALILHGAPTVDLHAATKKYVDDVFGAGVTDHGALTGLGDDDHAQYYNQARGDARYLRSGVDVDIGAHTFEANGFRIDNVDARLDGAMIGATAVLRAVNKAYDAWVPMQVKSLHIKDNEMWFTGEHHELKGLADDDHPQYMLKAPGYESDWTKIVNNSDLLFNHALGTRRLQFTIYVSDSSQGINAYLWMPHQYEAEQDRLLLVDNDNIRIYNYLGGERYFKVFIWVIPE